MALSGLKLPAIAAPMFMVSCPDLVVACCKAGLVGSFPALNQRDSTGYAAWIAEIRARLADVDAPAPFAVNLSLRRGSPRLEADLAVTVAAKIPVVLTSLGISRDIGDRIHDYGGIVLHDVTTGRHAEKAAEAGVDGLILVCAGAGGHAGGLNPFAFLREVRRWFTGTIALAGGISTGRDIAAERLMGADLVSMGTRFIATREADAPDAYKRMILASRAADIAWTDAPTGVPASFLKASLDEWGLSPLPLAGGVGGGHRHEQPGLSGNTPAPLTPPASGRGTIDTATRTLRYAGREGKVWRDLWSAGQGCGAIDDIPTASDLCARLIAEYRAVMPA